MAAPPRQQNPFLEALARFFQGLADSLQVSPGSETRARSDYGIVKGAPKASPEDLPSIDDLIFKVSSGR